MTTTPSPVPWGTDTFTNPFAPPPTAPAPVVEVRGCADCIARDVVGWVGLDKPAVRCRLAGMLPLSPGWMTPEGCPLRSGPVTLRLVERGRP